MRLTLRTLLAYLDDTLPADQAREIGLKVAENPSTQELIDRIKRMTRKRGLATPPSGPAGSASDANTVAEYLNDTLPPGSVAAFEETCLENDVYLAEVAACHQILTLVLCEQIPVPPLARRRMYELVKGQESLPNRKPGNTIPIGGVRDDNKPTFDDADDAPFLMGMSAFSRTDSSLQRFAKILLILGLMAMLAVAGYLAWPSGPTAPRDTLTLSTIPSTPASVAPETKSTTLPEPEITKPDGVPAPDGLLPKPEPIPIPNDPLPPIEDGGKKPTAPVARIDRVMIGKLEKKEPAAIVVRKSPTSPLYQRVMLDEPAIITTDPLVCLPGYKAMLRCESDVVIEMWGNLPDLFSTPIPLLAASLTPTLPHDGFDADFTLRAGRFYLSTKRPTGAKVRLRFRTETWDLVLPDDKSEVAIEVTHELTPGAIVSQPKTSVGLYVLFGTVTNLGVSKKPMVMAKGEEVYWDSTTNTTRLRIHNDAKIKEARVAYWSKFPVYVDAARANATLATLNGFAKSLVDPQRVRATFDEALQAKPDAPMQQTTTSARIAVQMFGSLGELTGLADCLSDPNRPVVRETAIEALRAAFAGDATLPDQFRFVLIEKLRMGEDQADATMRWLRGINADERQDGDTLDRLVKGLSADEVTVRELSYNVLLSYVDVKEAANRNLLTYDAGAALENRAAVVAAWSRKCEELKKKLLDSPTP